MQEELIKLAAFNWPIDAYLLKTRLEWEGISCYIFDDNIIGLNWLYSNVYINLKDVEKALEIVDQKSIEEDRYVAISFLTIPDYCDIFSLVYKLK